MLYERIKNYENYMAVKVVAVKVNGKFASMDTMVKEDDSIEYVDTFSLDGIRIYKDSLTFVLIKAANDIFPERRLKVHYSINKGSFCEFINEKTSQSDLDRIYHRMKEIISADMPIVKKIFSKEKAISLLKKTCRNETSEILGYLNKDRIDLFCIEDTYGYFYGQLVPSTGYVDIFDLKLYNQGFILFFPTRFNPFHMPAFKEQKKLFNVFKEHSDWGTILEADDVCSINRHVTEGKIKDLILANEALHEKKVAYIADRIMKKKKKFVMIAGPSSSGKTSFAKRLEIQLKVNGIHSYTISLDDYYKNRDTIPTTPDGEKDLETIEALDVELFNQNMLDIEKINITHLPVYDFLTQRRKNDFKELRIGDHDVIIIEGIHGLNPDMTASIDKKLVYKIYISALTSINIDDHNRLATTDTRLIRRITRDFSYRGASAEKTINMWPSVRRGEDMYIFPYQEQADVVFNSALIYEHGVLKSFCKDLLTDIPQNSVAYSEAMRLSEILSYFKEIDDKYISNTSLLREFIGGSQLL